MAFFDTALGSDESVFQDLEALDFDHQPKLVPYREAQQFKIAECIQPLFQKRPGKNLLIHGKPGLGKTVSLKHVLNEIEEKGMDDQVLPIYVNCWKKDTSYKLALDLCEQLGYKFILNKNTDTLIKEITKMLNKLGTVIILDEADKLKEVDVLYSIIEDVPKKSLILITNDHSWYHKQDARLKSRISIQELEFQPYSLDQVAGILKQRIDYALVPGVLDESAFQLISQKTFESKDLRKGLSFIREAGNLAEEQSSKQILLSHADAACKRLEEQNTKEEKVEPSQKEILDVVKENQGERLTTVYEKHKEKNPKYDKSYKTFKRSIDNLEKKGILKTKKISTEKGGNTTLVEYMS